MCDKNSSCSLVHNLSPTNPGIPGPKNDPHERGYGFLDCAKARLFVQPFCWRPPVPETRAKIRLLLFISFSNSVVNKLPYAVFYTFIHFKYQ